MTFRRLTTRTFAAFILLVIGLQAQVGRIAQVRHAPSIQGSVEGSLQQMAGESVALSGIAIISEDLYVPGTPTLRLNGTASLGGTSDGAGRTTPANYTITLHGNTQVGRLIKRKYPRRCW